MSFFANLKEKLSKVPRKVIYIVVAAIMQGIALRFPSLPLPEPDTITDWTIALVAAHSATDVAWLVKNFFADMAKERRENGSQL